VSVGAAAFPAEGRSGQQLIAAADRALYRRKQELNRTAAAPRRPRCRAAQPKAAAPA
jgi:predicted signal transduction protein with EAL and GGDEF domain